MAKTQQIIILLQRAALNAPTKILNHCIFLHLHYGFRVFIESIQRFAQGFGIGIHIILQTLSRQIAAIHTPSLCKENLCPKTVDPIINCINQPARRHRNRQRAFSHSFHLGQPARFKAARHQIEIGSQLHSICKLIAITAENKKYVCLLQD